MGPLPCIPVDIHYIMSPTPAAAVYQLDKHWTTDNGKVDKTRNEDAFEKAITKTLH